MIASAQRYPALLAVAEDRAYWFTSTRGPPYFWRGESGALAQLVGCPISGCGPNPTVLVGDEVGPHGIGVDARHVYWTRYGEVVSRPNGNYNDGAVMRMRRVTFSSLFGRRFSLVFSLFGARGET